jgi:uncharacterized membrane protein
MPLNISTRYQAAMLLVLWNTFVLLFRMEVSDTRWFFFFIWNLFLAILPFLGADLAVWLAARKRTAATVACLLFSVLFLPNSPYIITDLFHLRSRAEMPLWYDTLALFSIALSGLLFYYAALFDIYKAIASLWNRYWAEASVWMISFLSGYGIYLGRYLRFNSWDIMANPDGLFNQISNSITNPLVHTRTLGVTVFYGAFLLVGYWVVRLWERSIRR